MNLVPNPVRYFRETIAQERFVGARQIMEHNPDVTPEQIVDLETILRVNADATARNYVAEWYFMKQINPRIPFTDVITVYVDNTLPVMIQDLCELHNASKRQILENDRYFNSMVNAMTVTLDYMNVFNALEGLRQTGYTIDERDVETFDSVINHAFLMALVNNSATLTLHEPHAGLEAYWHSVCAMNPFLHAYAHKKRWEQLQFLSSCTVL